MSPMAFFWVVQFDFCFFSLCVFVGGIFAYGLLFSVGTNDHRLGGGLLREDY